MDCEEFELRGLDMGRGDADPQEAQQAARHVEVCGRCRAMLESWREAKLDLLLLRDATSLHRAPARVEMRLKQELRTRREARVPRRAASVAAWALAAGAVLAAGAGWMRTHTKVVAPAIKPASAGEDAASLAHAAGQNPGDVLLAADYDTGEFTQLPGSFPGAADDQSIVQVRMQRGALGRLGLPVDPERASELVNVDFLMGEDGQPQAVRLHQDSEITAVSQ